MKNIKWRILNEKYEINFKCKLISEFYMKCILKIRLFKIKSVSTD